MKKFLFLVCAGAALTACTAAEWNSINREFSAQKAQSQLIDAKQRAILAINKPVLDSDGRPVTYWTKEGGQRIASTPNVCAEPSPDALQATAAALSGAGNISRGDLAAALQAAGSTSEAAGSFGLRTQTIQLLRDSYYRLCEAFLNDGLDSISYDVLQRRFQNHIIALLAVEQLTGAVVGAQARLSSSAVADSGANLGLIAQARENQQKALAEAEAEAKTAADEVKKAEEQKVRLEKQIEGLRTELGSLPAKDSEAGSTQPIIDRRRELEAAIAQKTEEKEVIEATLPSLQDAKEESTTRAAFNREMLKLVTKTFDETADDTAKTLTLAMASGSDATRGRQGHNSEVVNAVRAITLNALNRDYDSEVCFEALRVKNYSGQYKNVQDLDEVGGANSRFLIYCEDLLASEVNLANARTRAILSRSEGIAMLVGGVARGTSKLKPSEVRDLILVLGVTTPLNDATSFLPQNLKFDTGEGGRDGTDGRSGASFEVRDVKVRDGKKPLDGTGLAALLKGLSAEQIEALLVSIDPGSQLSEHEIVTRIESITRAAQETRPACGPYEERNAAGACVSICGEGRVFNAKERQCEAKPAESG